MNFDDSEIPSSVDEKNERLIVDSLDEKFDELLKRDSRRQRHWVSKWLVRIVSVVFATIFIVYFMHLVLPAHRRWLEPEELEQIKSLALSIAVGVTANFASGYFKH